MCTIRGMATRANELHPWKALRPTLVTDEGMVTLVNDLHPWKADSSMLVTDGRINPVVCQERWGMATVFNDVHPRKAHNPKLVKVVGNVTLVTFSLSTLHSSHESCPSPFQSGWVMLTVPSGMAKCSAAPLPISLSSPPAAPTAFASDRARSCTAPT